MKAMMKQEKKQEARSNRTKDSIFSSLLLLPTHSSLNQPKES